MKTIITIFVKTHDSYPRTKLHESDVIYYQMCSWYYSEDLRQCFSSQSYSKIILSLRRKEIVKIGVMQQTHRNQMIL